MMSNPKMNLILEGLHATNISEAKNTDDSALKAAILKKYPKLSKLNLQVYYDQYLDAVSLFVGGKTNILTVELEGYTCDPSDKNIQKIMSEFTKKIQSDLKIPVKAKSCSATASKFFDAIGVNAEVSTPVKAAPKARITSINSVIKFISKNVAKVGDETSDNNFEVLYDKAPNNLIKEIAAKIKANGYDVQSRGKKLSYQATKSIRIEMTAYQDGGSTYLEIFEVM